MHFHFISTRLKSEIKMVFNNIVVLFYTVVFCLLGAEGQILNEGKLVRSTRQRSLGKRPSSVPISSSIADDSYVVANTKRPAFIEGGNQWKPLYNIPTRTAQSSQKYHTKSNVYSSKYQQPNNIYPQQLSNLYSTENHPKNSYKQSTATFIANQSLLVADLKDSSNLKPSPSYQKSKYRQIPKKNYNTQQYQVHEEVEDDSPTYTAQNQYSYHDIPLIKSDKQPIKPSIQYSETVEPEKHIHHVHYHDTMEEALRAGATKSYVRNFRGNPSARRPY